MLQAKKNRDHPGKRLIIQAVSVVGALGRPQLTAACLETRGSIPLSGPATAQGTPASLKQPLPRHIKLASFSKEIIKYATSEVDIPINMCIRLQC